MPLFRVRQADGSPGNAPGDGWAVMHPSMTSSQVKKKLQPGVVWEGDTDGSFAVAKLSTMRVIATGCGPAGYVALTDVEILTEDTQSSPLPVGALVAFEITEVYQPVSTGSSQPEAPDGVSVMDCQCTSCHGRYGAHSGYTCPSGSPSSGAQAWYAKIKRGNSDPVFSFGRVVEAINAEYYRIEVPAPPPQWSYPTKLVYRHKPGGRTTFVFQATSAPAGAGASEAPVKNATELGSAVVKLDLGEATAHVVANMMRLSWEESGPLYDVFVAPGLLPADLVAAATPLEVAAPKVLAADGVPSAEAAHPKALLDLLSSSPKPYTARDLPLLQALLQYIKEPSLKNAFSQLATSMINFFVDPAKGLLFAMDPATPDIAKLGAEMLTAVTKISAAVADQCATAMLDVASNDRVTSIPRGDARTAFARVVGSAVGDSWYHSLGSSPKATTAFVESAAALLLGSNAGDTLCGKSPALRNVLQALMSITNLERDAAGGDEGAIALLRDAREWLFDNALALFQLTHGTGVPVEDAVAAAAAADSVADAPAAPAFEPRPHNFVSNNCMVCTKCRQCTGYGAGCCMATTRARDPGAECGCGSGKSGCSVCGQCEKCCTGTLCYGPARRPGATPIAPVPATAHEFESKKCMVCVQCGNCTGYGSGCVRHAAGRARGVECGCGGGASGCAKCKRCKSCAKSHLCDTGGNPDCTYHTTGPAYVTQAWYHCETCGLRGNQGCCESCAKVCHAGHRVTRHRAAASFYCDCHPEGHCARLAKSNPVAAAKAEAKTTLGAASWTWSPTNKSPETMLAEGNMKATFRPEVQADCNAGVMASEPLSFGVHEWEMEVVKPGGSYYELGLCTASASTHRAGFKQLFGKDKQSWVLLQSGDVVHDGNTLHRMRKKVQKGDVVAFKLNAGTGSLTIAYGGNSATVTLPNWPGSAYPCAGGTMTKATVKVLNPRSPIASDSASLVVDDSSTLNVASLPPLRKFATVLMDAILRNVLHCGDDLCMTETSGATSVMAFAGAGQAASGIGGAGVSVAGGDAPTPAGDDDDLPANTCGKVVAALRPLHGLYSKLASAFVSHSCLLFQLRGRQVDARVNDGSTMYMTAVDELSRAQTSILAVGEKQLGFTPGTLATAEASLAGEVSQLLQGLLTTQLTNIKASLQRYLLTPSVLSTFTNADFVSLRTVMRYLIRTLVGHTVVLDSPAPASVRPGVPAPQWSWHKPSAGKFTDVSDSDMRANFQSRNSGSGTAGVRGSYGMRSGSHTWKVKWNTCGGTSSQVGICDDTAKLQLMRYDQLFGKDPHSIGVCHEKGLLSEGQATGSFDMKKGDVVTVKLDFNTRELSFSSSQGHSITHSLTDAQAAKTWFACAGSTYSGGNITLMETSGTVGSTVQPKGAVVAVKAADETAEATLEKLVSMWVTTVTEAVSTQLSRVADAPSAAVAADSLLRLYNRCREAAEMELFPGYATMAHQVPLAFRAAFRLLPQSSSAELAALFASLLNQALDSSVTSWTAELDLVDDLTSNSALFGGGTGLNRSLHVLSQTLTLVDLLGATESVSFFYRTYLGRRLATRRFLSLALEQNVLSGLGTHGDSRLRMAQRMLQDMASSEEAMQRFKAFCLDTAQESMPNRDTVLGLVFRRQVDVILASPSWPMNPHNVVTFRLPDALEAVKDTFHAFYGKAKPYLAAGVASSVAPRKLTWATSQGSAVVAASVPGWRGELILTPLQMTIVMLFNAHASLTVGDIVQLLMVEGASSPHALKRAVDGALLSLTATRHQLLTTDLEPMSVEDSLSQVDDAASYDDATVVQLHAGFAPVERVVQFHRVKMRREQLPLADRAALMAWRRQIVEAAIMKSVKGKGKVATQDMPAAVRGRVGSRFEVADSDVDTAVESLFDRGLLAKGFVPGASIADDARLAVWFNDDGEGEGGVEESKTDTVEAESKTDTPDNVPARSPRAPPPGRPSPLVRQYSTDTAVREVATLQSSKGPVQVLTGDAVADRLLVFAQQVAETLSLPLGEAETLCAKRDWKVDDAIAEYLRDQAGTRADVGLSPAGVKPAAPLGDITCMVCMDEVPASQAFASWCGHWFCNECWGQHVTVQVEEAKVPLRCMAGEGCPALIASTDLPLMGLSVEDVRGFRRALSHLYVSSTKTVGNCKNPVGCDGVLIAASSSEQAAVTCGKCSHTFCASCEFPPHSPSSCLLMSQWHDRRGYVELAPDEMAALELMYRVTKPCPKCGVRIQKNQGCPHMTCRACKYQFCWECRGKYHTSGTCNRPEEKGVAGSGTPLEFEAANAKCAQFAKVAKAVKDSVAAAEASRREAASSTEIASIGIRLDCLRTLERAYRVLAHTAVLAFFMQAGLVREQLEFGAQDLELIATRAKAGLDAGSGVGVTGPSAVGFPTYTPTEVLVSVLKSQLDSFDVLARKCSFVSSLQAEEKKRLEAEAAMAAKVAAEARAAMCATYHKAVTFHNGSLSTRLALSEGRRTARRTDSYHAVGYSSDSLTAPTYIEVEVTENERSWSGHLELGVCDGRTRVSSSNLSDLSTDVYYFKPAQGKGYSRGGSQLTLTGGSGTDGTVDPINGDHISPNMRFGLLYESGTLSLFVRRKEEDYLPKLFGTMVLPAGFNSTPYFVVNVYGQTRGVRLLPPP